MLACTDRTDSSEDHVTVRAATTDLALHVAQWSEALCPRSLVSALPWLRLASRWRQAPIRQSLGEKPFMDWQCLMSPMLQSCQQLSEWKHRLPLFLAIFLSPHFKIFLLHSEIYFVVTCSLSTSPCFIKWTNASIWTCRQIPLMIPPHLSPIS